MRLQVYVLRTEETMLIRYNGKQILNAYLHGLQSLHVGQLISLVAAQSMCEVENEDTVGPWLPRPAEKSKEK